jgi:hypothetical protein
MTYHLLLHPTMTFLPYRLKKPERKNRDGAAPMAAGHSAWKISSGRRRRQKKRPQR